MVARRYHLDCRKGLVLESGKPISRRGLYLDLDAERLKNKEKMLRNEKILDFTSMALFFESTTLVTLFSLLKEASFLEKPPSTIKLFLGINKSMSLKFFLNV